ncbi:unnamed protein product [Durusdinium trenchii]|uniref:3,4-dihydroxy-2-butanone-4-phosphate synthase n=1 Tax=Durusdinium trenchii TaxID=1381693 RepID=A0ABP0SUP0_9DINO
MELNTGALPPPGSAAYSTRHSWPSWRSSSSVRVPGATASPHRLSLTLSLCCARWFRHRAGRCHRAVPEAEAVERLRGVDEPLRTLVFPKLEGARCIALVKGQVTRREEAIPCRVHSECLLGDAFNSARCMCGPQLRSFIEDVLASSACSDAILLYLQGQEGKGIGLSNKLRTYVLQDEEGLGEEEANLRIGFPPDLRRYDAARVALDFLQVSSVILYTSSPRKLQGLRHLVAGTAAWCPNTGRWLDRSEVERPAEKTAGAAGGMEVGGSGDTVLQPASIPKWTRGVQRAELATLRRSNLEKFLPKNQPHENTFARIWGRSDPPLYTGEVAQQSPMVCTCAGVMRR